MRRVRSLALGVAAGVMVLYAGVANADILYGVSSNLSTNSSVYSINTSTGATTLVAALNSGAGNLQADQIGLASTTPTSTTIYASDVLANFGGPGPVPTFGSINLINGQYTPLSSINAQTGNTGALGIAPGAPGGSLYGVDNSNNLYTINPSTGAFTTVAALTGDLITNGGGLSDIAYDPATSTLIGVDNLNDYIYTINTTTGATVMVKDFSSLLIGAGNYYGLTWDAANSRYLLSAGNTGAPGGDTLYAIDPTTYAITTVGSLGAGGLDGSGIDGLAFGSSTPEPATIALAGFAVPALSWWAIKRRKAQAQVKA